MTKPFNDKNDKTQAKELKIKFFKSDSSTTWVDFANKNSIPVYCVNSTLKNIQFVRQSFEPQNIRLLIDDAKITQGGQDNFPDAVRVFPASTDKSEIAFVLTPGHVGVLYYDKETNKKYYIDTNGIDATPDEKEWLMRKNGFEHVVAKNKRHLDTRKLECEDYCTQAAMAVVTQFIKNEGKLDLGKIATDLNVTEALLGSNYFQRNRRNSALALYEKRHLNEVEEKQLNGFLKTLANKFRSEDNADFAIKFEIRMEDFNKIFDGTDGVDKYSDDPDLKTLCASNPDYIGVEMLYVLHDVKNMKKLEPDFIRHFKSNVLKQNPSSLADVRSMLEQIESYGKGFEDFTFEDLKEADQISLLSQDSQKHLASKALEMLRKGIVPKLEGYLVAYVERFKGLARIKSAQGVFKKIESGGKFEDFTFKGLEEADQISLLSPESQKRLANKALEMLQKGIKEIEEAEKERELLKKLKPNFIEHFKGNVLGRFSFTNQKSILKQIVSGEKSFADYAALTQFAGGNEMSILSKESQARLAKKALEMIEEKELLKKLEPNFIEHFKGNVLGRFSFTNPKSILKKIVSGEMSFPRRGALVKFKEGSEMSILSKESQARLAKKALEMIKEKELLKKLEPDFRKNFKDNVLKDPLSFANSKSILEKIVSGEKSFADFASFAAFKGGENMLNLSKESQIRLASKALEILREKENTSEKKSLNQIDLTSSKTKTNPHLNFSKINNDDDVVRLTPEQNGEENLTDKPIKNNQIILKF